MASDESLPPEIISLCVAATDAGTHYCQITHVGLVALNAHKQTRRRVTASQPLDSHFWIKTQLQFAAIVRRKRRIATALQRRETLPPARERVQTAPQTLRRDKSFFSQPRLPCLLPLISCLLCHTEARRLMGLSYATTCSCGLFFFFPFPINPCQCST